LNLPIRPVLVHLDLLANPIHIKLHAIPSAATVTVVSRTRRLIDAFLTPQGWLTTAGCPRMSMVHTHTNTHTNTTPHTHLQPCCA
jgi:hypothetical protein